MKNFERKRVKLGGGWVECIVPTKLITLEEVIKIQSEIFRRALNNSKVR